MICRVQSCVMAASSSRVLLACALLLLLLGLSVAAETNNTVVDSDQELAWNGAPPPMVPSIDCGSACASRCAAASRAKLCKRACGSCCARCNCVPPGTAGNHDKCPCYAAITTHGGRRKCP